LQFCQPFSLSFPATWNLCSLLLDIYIVDVQFIKNTLYFFQNFSHLNCNVVCGNFSNSVFFSISLWTVLYLNNQKQVDINVNLKKQTIK
jgi:hypothetical protein